ncbi:hypothetical protein GOV10_03860, partial [Candidatus Woesearchaeota archaeon]|nr:hypothetical protein [Candidatus Woesearchaeota archaeon]
TNICDETFTEETYVTINECLPENAGGGCGDGYHQVGGACVKNPVQNPPPKNPVQTFTTEPSGEGEDGGNSTDDGEGEEGEGDGNKITGGVTGFTFGNAWPWLVALLGLILVLFGASRLFKK